ncbi:MAG: type II toxin-antitoxin system VapC family toxin [Terracidiphilus sp.]
MKEYVLDANALVRFFRRTPGFLDVRNLVQQAREGRAHLATSVVNLGEVFYVLARYVGVEQAMQCVRETHNVVTVVPLNEQAALDAAMLRFHYKLGLADCAAAELAMNMKATLVTADPEYKRLGSQIKLLALPRHSA